MAIFNSYVKLPEGTSFTDDFPMKHPHESGPNKSAANAAAVPAVRRNASIHRPSPPSQWPQGSPHLWWDGPISSGWWYTYPSEKYEFVNGKDDIPYIMEKMFETTNQFL